MPWAGLVVVSGHVLQRSRWLCPCPREWWEAQPLVRVFVLSAWGAHVLPCQRPQRMTVCPALLLDHQRVKGQDLRTAVECDEPGDAGEGPRVREAGAAGAAGPAAQVSECGACPPAACGACAELDVPWLMVWKTANRETQACPVPSAVCTPRFHECCVC